MLTMLAGIAAGILHTFSGPDHLVALAPLAVGRKRAAWRPGFFWGAGHGSGVLAVGLLALWLKGLLPLELLSSVSERLVGVALIGIGLWGLRQGLYRRLHVHEHNHDGTQHTHIHYHGPQADHDTARAHLHSHVSFFMGVLHGLAGSALILGILPALALPSPFASMAYLLCFGLGSLAAMSAFTWLIRVSLDGFRIAGRQPFPLFQTLSSSLAIAVGAIWMVT